jgi:hypothetical protein
MAMTNKQQALVDHLKKQYPNGFVTIRKDGDPNGEIVFRGTVEELEAHLGNMVEVRPASLSVSWENYLEEADDEERATWQR